METRYGLILCQLLFSLSSVLMEDVVYLDDKICSPRDMQLVTTNGAVIFSHPGFGQRPYPNNKNCFIKFQTVDLSWRFLARLVFFDLRPRVGDDCSDYLFLFSSKFKDLSDVDNKFCGKSLKGEVIVSETSHMALFFRSTEEMSKDDLSFPYTGFKIILTAFTNRTGNKCSGGTSPCNFAETENHYPTLPESSVCIDSSLDCSVHCATGDKCSPDVSSLGTTAIICILVATVLVLGGFLVLIVCCCQQRKKSPSVRRFMTEGSPSESAEMQEGLECELPHNPIMYSSRCPPQGHSGAFVQSNDNWRYRSLPPASVPTPLSDMLYPELSEKEKNPVPFPMFTEAEKAMVFRVARSLGSKSCTSADSSRGFPRAGSSKTCSCLSDETVARPQNKPHMCSKDSSVRASHSGNTTRAESGGVVTLAAFL